LEPRPPNPDSSEDPGPAEGVLLTSEQKYRQLVEHAVDGIILGDPQGYLTDANPKACEMTGYRLEQLLGKHISELYPKEVLNERPLRFDLLREGRTIIMERCLLRADGTRLPVEMNSRRMPDGTYQAFLRDISERLAAQAELDRERATLDQIIDRNPYAIQIADADGYIVHNNRAVAQMFGADPPLGYSLLDDPGLERNGVREALLKVLEGQAVRIPPVWYDPSELLPDHSSGKLCIRTSAFPIPERDGQVQHIVLIHEDITAAAEAEDALRRSEARFRALCDNTTDSLFWIGVDEDGSFRVEGVNPAQERVLGLKNEDIAGKRLQDFLPAVLAEPILAHYRRCIEAAGPMFYEETAELRGESQTFETLLVPILDTQGRVYRIIGSSRDITQTRRAEEAVRQAQKLESLGILAGGIAHDFNNLLTAMLGNLNLAQLHSSPESPSLPYLENVEKILLRASDLTKQMLAYSGRGRFEVAPHELNAVVHEMTHLLNVSRSKKIALRYDLASGLPLFEADAAQIQQVVLNLVTNASEAIGEGEGVIRISTRQEELEAKVIPSRFPGQNLAPGLCVVLEVSDNGCGMGPEVIAKIFDPFFTTKRSGRGLGLSAMLGILRGHRAGIRIASAPGQGSTFTVYFPARADAPLLEPGKAPAIQGGRCQGRILLVDDEEVVRDSTGAMLRSLGLEVLQAVDGLDAIAKFQEQKGRIDLVLMDLTMPHLDGREAFVRLRALQPDLRVILFSGFSEGESLRDALGEGLAAFIQKPFDLAALKRTIHGVLGI
jgi:PAS domain S-box-containing protein